MFSRRASSPRISMAKVLLNPEWRGQSQGRTAFHTRFQLVIRLAPDRRSFFRFEDCGESGARVLGVNVDSTR